jgi:hypothetical protein
LILPAIAVLALSACSRPTFTLVVTNKDYHTRVVIVHIVDNEDGRDMGWYSLDVGESVVLFDVPRPTSKAYTLEVADENCEVFSRMGLGSQSDTYVVAADGEVREAGPLPSPLPSGSPKHGRTCQEVMGSPG